MGANHAQSRYLNRKEGDVEYRASNWSEVVTRALSHIDSSMCSSMSDLEMFETKLLLKRIDGVIQVRSNVDPTFCSFVGSGRSRGDHHDFSIFNNPYIPYQCMDSYLSSTGLSSTSMGK
ncbi:hypothetical protein V6Z11_A02G118100 [Gossypium hirsutum]